jgi:hypothetical protein
MRETKGSGIMAYKDKKDMAKYSRAYHIKHRDVIRGKKHIRQARNREFILQYRKANSVCTDCGNDDYRVIEFDHVRGVKKHTISKMAVDTYSIETIKKEIDKCDMRCANCHKIRHHELREMV